ncbi:hypothetical protein F5B22DRAFT_645426 [Xylaria bambusicola]|uniref:uncharacterized protein n=1 Tax=Xylaria bambusicola TaxID=326684 RepID=UPI0020072E1C|nr:uncharacterized protein F5B22DRAFT_645426 [Xylaria bambusicola]KAI0517718.1 hypothetical protein F5B22DRAFT_645426 [Xylaria bambusicola]
MRRDGEDVEATAQLVRKENDEHTHENSDFDYQDDDSAHEAYNNDRYRSSSKPLWRRLPFVSMPNSLPPILKSNKLNPRFIALIFGISFVTTVLVIYSYRPPRPTDASPAPAATTATTTTATASLILAAPTHTPLFKPDPEFCTTWPVDEDGSYDLDSQDRSSEILEHHSIAPEGGWRKPEGFRIIAMVFFGRKRYVDILDCYLRQNLASNGGYVDEVWFMVHTEVQEDISWLNALVKDLPDYKIVGQEGCQSNNGRYGCLWEHATADNTMYIKLDDDIVYIHQDAIPQLVHTRLAVPHAYAVSANLVNSPITGMEQFHHNAIYPFVQDPNNQPRHHASETWRLSEQARYPKNKLNKWKTGSDESIMYPKVPYRGHPFVLLSHDNFDLLHTSMGRYDQNPGPDLIAFSPVWRSWAMAAQQQYSLLYNLEMNQISRYFFGLPATYPEDAKGPDANSTVSTPQLDDGEPVLGGEQIFDTQFRRYNLNFCVVWGSDIKKHLPMNDDDEDAITRLIPRSTGRPFIIDTRAVVGHFSFFTQAEQIRQTDLLDRWRAFANEAVCAPDNLKKPWDLRCPMFNK